MLQNRRLPRQVMHPLFALFAPHSSDNHSPDSIRGFLCALFVLLWLVGGAGSGEIGRHGQLQEWLEDKDDPNNRHRHVSHLWGVYPGSDITWQTTNLFNAARQSLIFRGDQATGWSMGWKLNLWARFLDGDHAHLILRNLLAPVGGTEVSTTRGGGLYVNLFDAHPPFQID